MTNAATFVCAGMIALAAVVAPALASVTVSYSYDQLGRLRQVTYASGYTITYLYDAAGNRTSVVSAGVNQPPVANDDYVKPTSPGSGIPATVTFDPRINDSDPDGDPITIKSVQNPSDNGGSVVKNGGSSITYTAPSGGGADTFTYTIKDGQGHTATATVHVSG